MVPVTIISIVFILALVYKITQIFQDKQSVEPDEKTKQLISKVVREHHEEIRNQVKEDLRIELKEELRKEILLESKLK